MNSRFQRSPHRPPGLQSAFQSLPIDAVRLGPFREGARASIKCQMAAIAAVVVLLRICCPSDIARLVVPVVVNPVERVGWRRSAANVSEESSKALRPQRADRYSTPTVVLEISRLGVRAAGPHVLPEAVLGRDSAAIAGVPMASVDQPGGFDHPAPTRRGVPRSEMGLSNNTGAAAVTVAQEVSVRARPAFENFSADDQTFKPLPDHRWQRSNSAFVVAHSHIHTLNCTSKYRGWWARITTNQRQLAA